MKKGIFIVSNEQFGYHTDTYNYAVFLREHYNISFICFDKGLPRIELQGITVTYIPMKFKSALNRISFIYSTIKTYYLGKFDFVFINYFKGCSILRLFINTNKIMVDVRTLSVDEDETERKRYNDILKREIKKFKYISVISEGVKNQLELMYKNCFILGLGANTLINECIDKEKKFSDSIELIYVGTFDNRRIEDTIYAFNRVSEEFKNVKLRYRIIGFATDNKYEKEVLEAISLNKCKNIEFIGRVKSEELRDYFLESNIGISYIPITEFYNYQPPTKTYEYLLNGLFTIATNTFENRKIINNTNGILIEDSVNSFYTALKYVIENRNELYTDKKEVMNTAKEYTWEKISHSLMLIIEKCLKENEE